MDVEQTIEFILQQQAELTVRLEQLTATQSQQQEMIGSLVLIVRELAQRTDSLAEAQQRTDEKVQQVADNMNALIKAVDDLIRRDGRGPQATPQ